jgi:hypothetical protein
MILVPGAIRRISRAASMPFNSGIDISRIIRSGFSSRTLSTASLPFSASPQIFRCGLLEKILRIPARINSWSSAIRIRSGPSRGTSFMCVASVPISILNVRKSNAHGRCLLLRVPYCDSCRGGEVQSLVCGFPAFLDLRQPHRKHNLAGMMPLVSSWRDTRGLE